VGLEDGAQIGVEGFGQREGQLARPVAQVERKRPARRELQQARVQGVRIGRAIEVAARDDKRLGRADAASPADAGLGTVR